MANVTIHNITPWSSTNSKLNGPKAWKNVNLSLLTLICLAELLTNYSGVFKKLTRLLDTCFDRIVFLAFSQLIGPLLFFLCFVKWELSICLLFISYTFIAASPWELLVTNFLLHVSIAGQKTYKKQNETITSRFTKLLQTVYNPVLSLYEKIIQAISNTFQSLNKIHNLKS